MTNLEEMWEDEIKKQANYYKAKGDYLGYTGKSCINCGRNRVERYSTGIEICEKCGVDQKTKVIYENKYGSYLDFE